LTFATFARLLILVILPNLPELTFNLPICHFWKLLEYSGNLEMAGIARQIFACGGYRKNIARFLPLPLFGENKYALAH
jgi:hypothetical protein